MGTLLGFGVGMVEVLSGLIYELPRKTWWYDAVSYLNILPGLFAVGFYHLVHVNNAILSGIFYLCIVLQWTALGFLVAALLTRKARRAGSQRSAT